jgi:glycine cleavage system protein P-like pyridoxal-binding family
VYYFSACKFSNLRIGFLAAVVSSNTETESKETLDHFADTLIQIANEAKDDPDKVLEAPGSSFASLAI